MIGDDRLTCALLHLRELRMERDLAHAASAGTFARLLELAADLGERTPPVGWARHQDAWICFYAQKESDRWNVNLSSPRETDEPANLDLGEQIWQAWRAHDQAKVQAREGEDRFEREFRTAIEAE